MAPQRAVVLADFARNCKAATRAVSLYPGAHPAIATCLGRLTAVTDKLAHGSDVHMVVHPTALTIEDTAPARPDPSIGELAALLHSRLIGGLRVSAAATSEDWRAFLLLLASPVEDLLTAGGIGKAWAATGRGHFEIEEIDYASVLKERAGGDGATWDRVLAFCLKGETVSLDETVIDSLLAAVRDSGSFASLLDRLQEKADSDGASLSARVAALFQLLKTVLAAADASPGTSRDHVLDTVAQASAHLTPDMILALIAQRDGTRADDAQLASGILNRMTDASVASFVARSVTAERGATARLAHAFEALVPDPSKKASLLEQAREEAQAGELGQEPQFEHMWADATKTMLTTYSDEGFVSAEYARELTAARTQAIEVERLADDPPDRISGWLATVNDTAIRALDLQITVDLLAIEHDDAAWGSVALLAVGEIERRLVMGDLASAVQLAEAVAAPRDGSRPSRLEPAERAIAAWIGGAFPRHLVSHLRKAGEAEMSALARLSHLAGAALVRPLAEALANEGHVHTIRRLKELLISFGPAGRHAIEPLKASTNPAVRRTAIDLLRLFGGPEALRELTAMLTDADPQVQQDSIRAIVQIGSKEAYGILEHACASGAATRDAIVRELVSLRDPKAIPPLCYVLTTTEPSGSVAALHESIIEALASLRAHPESTSALRRALDRGAWWAPRRTARLRHAAAKGLRRLGSDDARAALEDAARAGSRRVRKIASAELAAMTAGVRL
jgi:hypothetical protein